jgi:hypothetical protein
VTERAGLLFVHSHPDPGHPIGFSDVDRSAIASLAATIVPILEGPFGAAVVQAEGWAGTIAEEGGLRPIERIASVGRSLRILSPARSVLTRRTTDVPGLDDRQRDALGTVHDILAQLDLAVVGVGGTGLR